MRARLVLLQGAKLCYRVSEAVRESCAFVISRVQATPIAVPTATGAKPKLPPSRAAGSAAASTALAAPAPCAKEQGERTAD
jgi:hypothetical protein